MTADLAFVAPGGSMLPMIAVTGTLLVLAVGFAVLYQIAKYHDLKNNDQAEE